MNVTFSVIIPTSGRSTASWAIQSAVSQLEPGDEILVVRDSTGDFGDRARNSAVERAAGTHLVFLDDDDEFVDGALDAMRSWARTNPHSIGIFTRDVYLWPPNPDAPSLDRTVSGNYCVPNVPGRLGRFVAPPGHQGRRGDIAFITETARLQGDDKVAFTGIVTQIANYEHNPLRRLRHRISLRRRLGL